MTTEAGALADSRAILIGVSAYEYAELPPIRAARNSLQAMHALLSDPRLCAWPPTRITVIANPISVADLAAQIADIAESTAGVLLLYYVGHGLLSPSAELCLTVTSTRPNRPKISGLPWDTLADVLRTCPAKKRMVILDCCFAGQAIQALAGDGELVFADIAHVEGVYTLAATTRNRPAHVPPSDQQDTACTSFTGELRNLIRSGIPGKPPQLTFGDIYPILRQRLQAKGLPIPSQHGTDTIHQFPFTANAAAGSAPNAHNSRLGKSGFGGAAQKNPDPRQTDGGWSTRLLEDALHAAYSIPRAFPKAVALGRVAEVLATTDPGRAARLIADIERIAESITDASEKALVLAPSTTALAATDPEHAERIARSTTDAGEKACALAGVAERLAASDLDSAARLIADAERIAQSITDAGSKASALARVAGALAATDPDHAERIAQSITDAGSKASALARVAGALVASDPDRSARLFADANRDYESIIPGRTKETVLASVAGALAATDPDHAERIAQSITDGNLKAWALAGVAGALAATDPDHAERVAESIARFGPKAVAMGRIAAALAATDPFRASRLIADAERIAGSSTAGISKALALAGVAKAWTQGWAGPLGTVPHPALRAGQVTSAGDISGLTYADDQADVPKF